MSAIRRRSILTLALLPILSPSAAVAQQRDDEAAIRALIADHYVAAVFETRDPASVRQAFHPLFRLYAIDDGQLLAVTLDEWLAHLELDGVHSGSDARHDVVLIDITDDAATARTELYVDGEHEYTDYFLLYRLPGEGWRVVAKVFASH